MFIAVFHDSLPFVPILSQIKPIHAPPPIFLRSILISCHLCLGLASVLFPSGFLTKISYAFHISSIHDTCSVHLRLLDLIVFVVPSAN